MSRILFRLLAFSFNQCIVEQLLHVIVVSHCIVTSSQSAGYSSCLYSKLSSHPQLPHMMCSLAITIINPPSPPSEKRGHIVIHFSILHQSNLLVYFLFLNRLLFRFSLFFKFSFEYINHSV